MVKEQAHYIDISAKPELVRMAEEVQRTKTRALLARNDEVLAEIRPAPSRKGTARRFRAGQVSKQSQKALGQYERPPTGGIHQLGRPLDSCTGDRPTLIYG
jgi:hypothetical protein